MYRCTHLTCGYALNRFLVLLIAQYLKEFEERSTVLESKAGVTRVEKDAHPPTPCGDPKLCHGKDHKVYLQDFPECWEDGKDERKDPEIANVVILRHGIETKEVPWISLTPLSNPREVLPCYLH